MGSERLIIDRVANFSLSASDFHNEIGTVESLWTGLQFLSHQVANLEHIAQASPAGQTIVGFFSDLEGHFGLPPGANALLPCFYQWFGTTAVNMVRMIGLLQGQRNGSVQAPPYETSVARKAVKDYCSAYVATVPEMADVLSGGIRFSRTLR